MEVWFGPLLLGEVDLATRGLIRADLRLNIKRQKVVEIRPNKTAKEDRKSVKH
jgi:hypothetical protein